MSQAEAGVLMLPNLEFLKCIETLSFTNKRLYTSKRVPSALPARLKLTPSVTRLAMKYRLLKWEELSILHTLPSVEVLKLLDKPVVEQFGTQVKRGSLSSST